MSIPRHLIMSTMILSGISSFIVAQEAPATEEQNIEQVTTSDNEETAAALQAQESSAESAEVESLAAPEKSEEASETPSEESTQADESAPAETAAENETPSEEAATPEKTEAETPAKEAAAPEKSDTKAAAQAFEKFERPKSKKAAPEQEETPEPAPAEETKSAAEKTPATKTAPVAKAAPVEEAALENEINLLQIPAPIEEQEVVIPDEIIEEEPIGIDTMSLDNPQGNWLFKRIWWERAEERYEKIRILVDTIWEFRTKFFIERSKLDRDVLDPFYISVGIDQGELEAILAEINEFLETQSSKQEDMSDDERLIYENYATQEEALKSLQNDVLSIGRLDKAVDEALRTLMDQINRVRQYETDAWKNFKEIAKILNDTKARELYFTIDGAAKNIKSISSYLEREFFTHFNKLITDAAQVVNRVQRQMDALKEKGIRFQRQTEIIEQQKQQAAAEDEDDEDEDDEEVQPKPKLGWVAWIGSLFSKAFNTIFSIIRMPYDMIFGK
jgi:hypothetical protein